MAINQIIRRIISAPKQGGVQPPYPAPTGFYWQQIVEDGQPVTEDGSYIFELERIAA